MDPRFVAVVVATVADESGLEERVADMEAEEVEPVRGVI